MRSHCSPGVEKNVVLVVVHKRFQLEGILEHGVHAREPGGDVAASSLIVVVALENSWVKDVPMTRLVRKS